MIKRYLKFEAVRWMAMYYVKYIHEYYHVMEKLASLPGFMKDEKLTFHQDRKIHNREFSCNYEGREMHFTVTKRPSGLTCF